MFYLKEIELTDEEKFTKFITRYKEECKDESIPISLNKENLPFSEFFKKLQLLSSLETCPKGFVPSKYFLIMVDDSIVGEIHLRYMSNDFILNFAGHVGYGIAPWERRKGYATRALKKLMIIAKDMKLERLLLTTDEDNVASQKVIVSCGGRYEKSNQGKRHYWIDLGEWILEESAMAIVFYKDEILATKENVYGNCVLSCPKGHVEDRETYIETAIRECFEETNVSLTLADYKKELNPYIIKFVDHHNQFIQKIIYPICFHIKEKGRPLAKEERILSVEFMKISKFLEDCSYDNVRQMVGMCFR